MDALNAVTGRIEAAEETFLRRGERITFVSQATGSRRRY